MAISSAVHPVRVEKLEADQKVIKTVTIADPPTIERSNRCTHNQNQNVQCAKLGVSSPGQTQDKKSILIKKRNLTNYSIKTQVSGAQLINPDREQVHSGTFRT